MARVLVTGAGSGAANSFLRDLLAGDPGISSVGCNADRFALMKSSANTNYLVNTTDDAGYVDSLNRVIGKEGIDFVIPTNDDDVSAIARSRNSVAARAFLPSLETIEQCRDKYHLTQRMEVGKVPVPRTYAVSDLAEVSRAFEVIGSTPLWCRTRGGSGSSGAAPVANPEQARWWISYWSEMRGVPVSRFTLSEYLPGRDFFAQGLWKDGELVVIKTCERLSYFVVGGAPSGTSSASRLSKTIRDSRIVAVCVDAVRAIDSSASGTFNFDLKEDVVGRPCLTEINAGRFPAGAGIFNLTGKYNLALLYLRLGVGEVVDVRGEDDSNESWYQLRDLDALPGVFRVDDLFDHVEDARGD